VGEFDHPQTSQGQGVGWGGRCGWLGGLVHGVERSVTGNGGRMKVPIISQLTPASRNAQGIVGLE